MREKKKDIISKKILMIISVFSLCLVCGNDFCVIANDGDGGANCRNVVSFSVDWPVIYLKKIKLLIKPIKKIIFRMIFVVIN